MADSREEALALAGRYHYFHAVQRAFELAWAHGQLELRHLHLSPEDIHVFQRLAAHIFYANPAMRADAAVLKANQQGQPGLWRYGISGDNPIVVVWVDRVEEIPLVRQLLAAHAYWRSKGLRVDLVVLNEHETVYFEELQKELQALMRASEDRDMLDKSGGVYLRKAAADSQRRPKSAASGGSLRAAGAARNAGAANRADGASRVAPDGAADPARRNLAEPADRATQRKRCGRAARTAIRQRLRRIRRRGGEYIVSIPAGGNRRLPPCAVDQCGGEFSVRFSGFGKRSRLHLGDQQPDKPPDAMEQRPRCRLRRAKSSIFATGRRAPSGHRRRYPWAILWPIKCGTGKATPFSRRAIQSWSRNCCCSSRRTKRSKSSGLPFAIEAGVPGNCQPLFTRNGCWERFANKACLNVITELDAASGALLARNPFNADFPERTAYADVDIRPRSFTADRTEFLGRNGSLAAPAALGPNGLSGTVGPGIDPCAALQVEFDLPPGGERTITFFLGQTGDEDEIQWLLRRDRDRLR